MTDQLRRGVFKLFEMVDEKPLQVNMTNVWDINDMVFD